MVKEGCKAWCVNSNSDNARAKNRSKAVNIFGVAAQVADAS